MSDLVESVRSWLATSGYPLEMQVASAMQQARFSVVQSEYFEDPDSGKWRETDVIGYTDFRSDTCRVILALIAECKSAKNPWVLFTSRDGYPRSLGIARRAASQKGESILNVLASKEELSHLPLFVVPERPGYGLGVACSSKDNHDAAFAALNSVCKASLGLIRRIESVGTENLIPFAWPILIVNAPLLEAFLDEGGDLRVQEVGKGLLIWRNPVIRSRHTLVQVYNIEQFLEEAADLRKCSIQFAEIAAEENDRSPR